MRKALLLTFSLLIHLEVYEKPHQKETPNECELLTLGAAIIDHYFLSQKSSSNQ